MISNTNLFIFAIIVIALIFLYRKQENFTSTESNEAIQNIASVYADTSGTATFNNINVTAWRGMVTMWSGTINNIPSGWLICDGTNGTPDLRGRFVLGYNTNASEVTGTSDNNGFTTINTGARAGPWFSDTIGKNGGEVRHTLSTKEIPSHTHSVNVFKVNTWHDGGGTNGGTCCIASGNGAQNVTVTNTTDGGAVGNGPLTPNTPHNTLPPFYVLAYIMKS
jgi:microcystin-dependent protein